MNYRKLLLIVVCFGMFCQAQNYHELTNVSKVYTVIVNAQNCGKKSCNGKTAIDLYDKGSMKKIQTLSSDNFYLELNENRKPLIDSLKNSIVFEDFNFDGNEDFAFADGIQLNKKALKIYLKNESNQQFVFNEEFTYFMREHSGKFSIDSAHNRIVTNTKKGCCWSQRAEYIFTPEQRFLKVYEFEEDTKDPQKVTTVEREFKDYKWSAKTTIYPREKYFKEQKSNENPKRN